MSTTIDIRVLEMQFDNKRFEQNVQTSLGTIEKLKQSLNFTGAAKGLESIDNAANGIKMSGLQSAVETVGLRFNAMYTIADQALRNIVNSAMTAGKRIVSALTIDPIKSGFSEYETQINAVQTILANTESKGKTLNDVNAALDELNTYADKTIYNFTEMTRNIGTFTAAGVDLDTSVSAIKGIANLAAVSGSTSQQASTAMYQLSQALASGTVKLMDWNSVVNAGMGGQVFQDALKETARVHGIAIDDLIKKEGSFRETLQHGWLSSEILTETLSKFTGDLSEAQLKSMGYTDEQIKGIIKMGQTANDAATKVKTFTQLFDTLKEAAQSGWTQTWEIIVGDFEEAKAFLTEVSDTIGGIIGSSAEARNEMLENWKALGGRTALLDSIRNAFEGIMSIVKPIKDAFREIFPPVTSEQLYKLTEGLKNLTAKLKLSDKTSDNLKRTFKGLFAVADIIRQVFVAVFKAVGSLLGGVGKLGGGILGVTASFGDWLVKLNESIKKSDIFNKALQGVVKAIKFVFDGIYNLVSSIGSSDIFHKILSGVGNAISGISSVVASAFESMSSSFENWGVIDVFKSLWNIIKVIGSKIGEVVSKIGELFGIKLGDGDMSGVLDLVKAIVTGGLGASLIGFVNSLKGTFDGFSDLVENITDIFGGLADVLDAYQTKLKAEALIKIAAAIAILSASVLVLSLIDSDRLYDSIVAISMLFVTLIGSLAMLNKTGNSEKAAKKLSKILMTLSISVLILASALKTVSSIHPEQLVSGLLGVAGLIAIMVGAAAVLGKVENTMKKGAMQMVIFAAAIKVLASACKDLSVLSWEELAKGLVGVGVLLAEVSLFLNTAKFSGKSVLTATGIVILAAAIKVLASACKDFGRMQWNEIGKGLTSIGILLAEIMIFTRLTGNAKHVISTGVALIAIAAAMKIFASATQDMATMSWEDIAKGLVTMAGALAAVTIAVNLMPKNMVSKGVGLIAVSTALLILSTTLGKLGGMSWESIGKGLTSLGGSMIILAIGLNAMKGTAGGSAALLIATAALVILTPVLKSLGSMSWESIAKGLITIAGAFTILGIAGAVLGPIVPAIISLAGAMALVGASILALGLGLLVAGTGLSAIATGILALIGALTVGAVSIVDAIASIVTGIIKGLADGILMIIDILPRIIREAIPLIGETIKSVIITLCSIITDCAPLIVDTILNLIVSILDGLAKYTPKIVDALFNFVIGVLEAFAKNIPRLVKVVFDIIMSLFTGVVDALGQLDFETLVKGMAGIGLIAGVIAALSAITPLIPGAMAGVLGMGIVIAELALVLAAIGALAQIPGLKWLIDEGGELMKGIGNAIGGLIGGLIGGVAEGMTSSLPKIGSDLSDFMTNVQPFLDGASNIDSSVFDGVKSLVGVILSLTGANILKGLTSWISGGSSLAKFGEELAEFGPYMAAYANSISGVDPSVIEASANAAKALAKMCDYIPNEGGIVSWFTGENSIAKFGTEIVSLGEGLKGFSDAIYGIVPENITAAANAAKALAQMCNYIPNEGGIVSWFTGDNSVAKFGDQLPKLGEGLKGFSDSIYGVVPENITAAANAAKALAEMCTTIPNEGGIISWITGDNSISKYGDGLIDLGKGLKGFSDALTGMNAESVNAGINAAKALTEMSNNIPNSGGMVSWFTGDNSVAKFGDQLPKLGHGLKGFSDALVGVNIDNLSAAAGAAKSLADMCTYIPNSGGIGAWFTGENSISKFGDDLISLGYGLKGFSDALVGVSIDNLISGSNAAKTLAEMSHHIPNSGGIGAWFTGEASISKFSGDLISLGHGLKGFSDAIAGINPENMTSASNATKVLAEMSQHIPNSGGIGAWFTGEASISKFGGDLISLGYGLKGFSDAIAGINPENMTSAANAAKVLVEMTNQIPNSGGVVSWFTGEASIAKFGGELISLGYGLKGFSDAIAGINAENITSASNAAKALAEMTAHIPNSGGVKAWFTGDASISKFSDQLPGLGRGLKGFSDALTGLVPENVTAAANAGKSLAEMTKTVPSNTDKLSSFGDNVKKLGSKLKEYFTQVSSVSENSVSSSTKIVDAVNKISSINSGGINSATNAIKEMIKMLKDLSSVKASAADGFTKAIERLGKTNVDGLVKAFEGAKGKLQDAGKNAVNALIDAIKNSSSKVETAGKGLVSSLTKGVESGSKSFSTAVSKLASAATSGIKDKYQGFYSAGKYLADGFASGISANSFKAAAKASAMAKAAEKAARKALDINSPSKVFIGLGSSIPEGFAIGIEALGRVVSSSTVTMTDDAIDGVKKSIARISDVVNSDIDAQPTIRPVIDLSNVRSGAEAINGMLNMGASVGVMANVGAISSMMSKRNQNGDSHEMVSAINGLRKDLREMPRTVNNINGITYDDGSNIADAVHVLVRAAKVERRK